MSATARILAAKPHTKKLIGYVAGIIWPADGFEWLASATDLASQHPCRKDQETKVYSKIEQANARRDQLLAAWGDKYQPFVRPYYHWS